jgi:hypothetical protein
MDSPLMVEAEDGYKVVLSTRSIPFPVSLSLPSPVIS